MNGSEMSSHDCLIDLSGEKSGGTFSKRMIVAILGSLALFFLLSRLDLSEYGPNCAKAIGFVAAVIFWMIAAPTEMVVAALLIVTLGTFSGVFAWSDVTVQLGASSFYAMLGMVIVADSITCTKFGERLSYWLLYKLGKKPVMLVLVFCACTSVISGMVSNVATILLMSGIANALLINMGEEPGKSKLGKTLMAMIPMAALFGGFALINGAPIGNLNGISYMNSASGDLNATVTYVNWAKISVPSFLICLIPCIVIYSSCFRMKNDTYNIPSPEYFQNKLKSLGKMGGSEWRWIVITIGMVVSMLLGMNSALAALTFAVICMLPGIGLTSSKSCIKKLPWGVLLCVCMCPMIGKAITGNGVSVLLADLLIPYIGNMHPLLFSMVSMFTLFLAMNLMVNATHGAHAMVVSIFTPICIALGYDPSTVMLPTLFAGGFFWVFGANYYVMMNKGYGWWEMKDTILPGFLSGIFVCIVIPIINYVLTPLWGLSLYL